MHRNKKDTAKNFNWAIRIVGLYYFGRCNRSKLLKNISHYATILPALLHSPVAQSVEHLAVHEVRSAECKTRHTAPHGERR